MGAVIQIKQLQPCMYRYDTAQLAGLARCSDHNSARVNQQVPQQCNQHGTIFPKRCCCLPFDKSINEMSRLFCSLPLVSAPHGRSCLHLPALHRSNGELPPSQPAMTAGCGKCAQQFTHSISTLLLYSSDTTGAEQTAPLLPWHSTPGRSLQPRPLRTTAGGQLTEHGTPVGTAAKA